MAPTITDLSVSETYASLTILTQAQLTTAMTSIETWCNAKVKLNMIQMALDAFGATYAFNDDGIQTRANPLITDYAELAGNEVVTGAWTFSGNVINSGTVTSSSTFTSTGQQKCRCHRSVADQSIDDTTLTAISWDTESYDTGALHSTAVSPTRISIPTGGAGVYLFNTQVTFAAGNTGFRTVGFYKNGSLIGETKCFNPHATELTVLNLYVQDNATDADYFEVKVYHSQGAPLDVKKGEYVTFVQTIRVW